MFALKFKGFGWHGNELRYSFIAFAAVTAAVFTRYAVPTVILMYIIVSTVRWAFGLRKA